MAKAKKSKVSKTKVSKTKVTKSKGSKTQVSKTKVSAVKAVKKVNAAPKQKKSIKAKAAVVSKPQKTSNVKKASVAVKTSPTKSLIAVSNNLTPLEDRIIVKVSMVEKVTAGGIIIPETAQVSGNLRGVVVAVGKGKRNKKGVVRPLDVKKGDEVLFSEFVGTKTDLGGQEVCILRESEILGRVE